MTAIYPEAADLRVCRLYRFYGWDPRTNYTTKTLIYVGETIREPFDRLMEHIARQPWADTITGWEVDDRIFASKDDVVVAEKAAVEAESPLYNDEFNRGNDERVELEEAKLQRWARDDARRVRRWRPRSSRTMYRHGQEMPAPESGPSRPYGQVRSSADRASPPVRQSRSGLTPVQWRLIGWGSAWLVLWITGWVLGARHHLTLHHCRDSAIAATVLLLAVALWLWLGCPVRPRTWRRRVRRKLPGWLR